MTADDLVELRRIEELKYRYLRCVDLHLWSELREVLHPEARASYGGGVVTPEGREAIIAFLEKSMGPEGSDGVLSSHKCHHPEITLADDRRSATATWALEDVVINKEFGITVRGAAFYSDEYVREGDDWLISYTGYTRVYEEIVPRANVEGLSLTAEYWATDGRSTLPIGE